MSVMKKGYKSDRPVVPISLAPRKHAFRVLPETSPQRSDFQGSILKSYDSNRQINQTATLSTLRKNVNTVKQDVDKLSVADGQSQSRLNNKPGTQTLKNELTNQKHIEQQLRRELRQTKTKLEESEDHREDKYKNIRDKDIIADRINKLQHDLMEANRMNQIKDDSKTQRIQCLSQELQKVQIERNSLESHCARLEGIVNVLRRPKMDQETQQNEDEVLNMRSRMYDYDKEKLIMASRLKQKQLELKRLYDQSQSIYKEKDAKYIGCLNEFKKLELKLSRSKDESMNILRTKLQQLEAAVFASRQSNESLRSQNTQLINRVQRVKNQYDEQKHINDQMTIKVRNLHNQITNSHRIEVSELHKKMAYLESQLRQANMRFEQKCREADTLEQSRSQIVPPTVVHNEELHRAKVQILSLEIQINQLNNDLQRYRQEIKGLEEVNQHKNIYISELQKQKDLMDQANVTHEIEVRYRGLYEDQNRMSEEYQRRILILEVQLQKKSEEVEFLRSVATERATTQVETTVNFDGVLKQQLSEIQHLKITLNSKNQQVLNLKNQVQEFKRRADNIKSQTQIDKLKGITEEKTLKSHYDILLQNLKSDLDSQKRKYECLLRKAEFRADQLKKKDEFIQQVIIGKTTKSDITQGEYLRKQLEKFFSINYQTKLLTAQQRIKQLESKYIEQNS